MELQQITKEAAQAAQLLLETAKPKPGALCVIGCSTSEVGGQMIGSASSTEIAAALWERADVNGPLCGIVFEAVRLRAFRYQGNRVVFFIVSRSFQKIFDVLHSRIPPVGIRIAPFGASGTDISK